MEVNKGQLRVIRRALIIAIDSEEAALQSYERPDGSVDPHWKRYYRSTMLRIDEMRNLLKSLADPS